MDDRLNVVLRGVRDAVEAWEDVRSRREAAVAAANQAVRTAEARLKISLRGVALGRWRTLVSGRPSLTNPRVARQVHLAAESKQQVEAALTALAEAQSARDAIARSTEQELSSAARRLLGFGRLAELVTAQARIELCQTPSPVADSVIPIGVEADDGSGGGTMAARDTIRDCQRRIAQLDAAHGRALGHLAAAQQKRTEVLAAQDALVADAKRGVDEALVAMATEVGPDLAAYLLDRDLLEVRRLMKRRDHLRKIPANLIA
jgi:hypothetical protein